MRRDSYADTLRCINRLTEPALRRAVAAFAPPAGSRGLDAGCGVGDRTLILAAAVGAAGRVTGLDHSTERLAAARASAGGTTPVAPVHLVAGDIRTLPFDDGSFDWVWSADVLWPHLVIDDPVAAVRELARIVRPGGEMGLAYWSGQSLLCGHPELEARLTAAFAETAPYLAGVPPAHQHMRALGWFREAGLEHAVARSFVADLRATAGARPREAIARCFTMLWGGLEPHLSARDWQDYRRLCDPSSPDSLLDDADYHGSITYTLFQARVPDET